MASPLVPCPSCTRHVRVSEQACPFCAASLPASFAATPAPRAVAVRLKRAALAALGAGTLTAVGACEMSSSDYGAPPSEYPATDSGADIAPDVTVGDAFVCCDPSCAMTKPLGCNECFCSGGQWVCSTFSCEDALSAAPADATPDAPVGADASDGGPLDGSADAEGD